MKGLRTFGVTAAFVVVLTGIVGATALDDYVAAADDSYAYSLFSTTAGFGYKAFVLNLTSQAWRSQAEVNRPLWRHWLHVVVPATVSHNTALLVVSGGDYGDVPATGIQGQLGTLALYTQSVVTYLENVPNQPLRFADRQASLMEDEIIAYSWDKYFVTGDATWIVQLPMVKSAVRAMDAVQDFCATTAAGGRTINRFAVGGASKRGWAAWLTAAVDERVTSVAPIVIDLLNMDRSFRHHYAAYGFWAKAVHDYERTDVFTRFDSEAGRSLLAIVDPHVYRDRLTMPKYILNSAGDGFFLPDSWRFYWDDLPAPKYLRYVPNSGHGLDSADLFESLAVCHMATLTGQAMPQYVWRMEEDGTLLVQTLSGTLTKVTLWQATNPRARDFRLTTIGAAWTSTPLTDEGGGSFVAHVETPATGWRAFFVELVYASGLPYPYKFTTGVYVVPDELPWACDLDFDGVVSLPDVARAARDWQRATWSPGDVWPAGGDGMVDIKDLWLFAGDWLKGR